MNMKETIKRTDLQFRSYRLDFQGGFITEIIEYLEESEYIHDNEIAENLNRIWQKLNPREIQGWIVGFGREGYRTIHLEFIPAYFGDWENYNFFPLFEWIENLGWNCDEWNFVADNQVRMWFDKT